MWTLSFWTSFIFWSADILVNFNTAVYHHGRLETSKAVIASHYFRGWFLIDVGLVTLDWVIGVRSPTNTGPKPSCSRPHAMMLCCIGRMYHEHQQPPRAIGTCRHTEGWKHGLCGVRCFVKCSYRFLSFLCNTCATAIAGFASPEPLEFWPLRDYVLRRARRAGVLNVSPTPSFCRLRRTRGDALSYCSKRGFGRRCLLEFRRCRFSPHIHRAPGTSERRASSEWGQPRLASLQEFEVMFGL